MPNISHNPKTMPSAIDTGGQASQNASHSNSKGEYVAAREDKQEVDIPARPSISPLTPTASYAQLHTQTYQAQYKEQALASAHQNQFIERPKPLPIDDNDNTDAMALKSAIAVLQLQRQKSQQDLRTLQRLREAAAKDPEYFAGELVSGNLAQERSLQNPLQATFDGESDDEDDDSDTSAKAQPQALPRFPNAQNIFRTPPINWDKYHVVGNSLDRMHADQQSRPFFGEPSKDQRRDHVIAAPYSPFVDKAPQQPLPNSGRAPKK